LVGTADEETLDMIARRLSDSNENVRKYAVTAFKGEKGLKYFDLLVKRLRDSDVFVREEAIIVLGSIGDKRAIKYILPFIDENREDSYIVGKEAKEALMKLGWEE